MPRYLLNPYGYNSYLFIIIDSYINDRAAARARDTAVHLKSKQITDFGNSQFGQTKNNYTTVSGLMGKATVAKWVSMISVGICVNDCSVRATFGDTTCHVMHFSFFNSKEKHWTLGSEQIGKVRQFLQS